MYCPPESGNIDPNSANAKHAQSEINAPSTHTSRNSTGWGSGPAISFAVRKIDDPMIPLTSSNTESSNPSPRTNVGFDPVDSDCSIELSGAGKTGVGSIIQCLVHPTTPAPCHSAGKLPTSSLRTLGDLSLPRHNWGNRAVRALHRG